MKKFIFAIFFLLSWSIFAQNKEKYTYDPAGNRNTRNTCACRQAYQAPNYDQKDTAAVAQAAAQEGVAVFPNPTPAGVSVKIGNFKAEEGAKLYVLDASGKVMIAEEAKSLQTELDFSRLMQGIYYVRVIKGGKEFMYKVIKVQ